MKRPDTKRHIAVGLALIVAMVVFALVVAAVMEMAS